MLLETLKQYMLLPEKEFLINKATEIRGVPALLIAITSQAEKNALWLMQFDPCPDENLTDERPEILTNKEQMLRSILNKSSHVSISEIVIQGQKMTFCSSRTKRIMENSYEAFMQLQHFIERGLNSVPFEGFHLSDMMITQYEQTEGEAFPHIDSSKECDITVKINKKVEQVLIGQPFSMSFDDRIEKGRRQSFYDTEEKRERFFYINGLKHYDIWKETEEQFNSDEMQKVMDQQNLSPQEREEMKKKYWECTERICPKGHDLAVLEYETEDNIQLNFYSREHLDKTPKPNSSSIGLIITTDEETGLNGYKKRIGILHPIAKDFYGKIDMELFSWYWESPEESISL